MNNNTLTVVLFSLWFLFFYQQTEAQTTDTCGVANPITDLAWLADLGSGICSPFSCDDAIVQATYNGNTIFYTAPNALCSDGMTSVLSCEGDFICGFGGFAGLNGEGCPQFWETVNNQQVLISQAACSGLTPPSISLNLNAVCLTGEVPPPNVNISITATDSTFATQEAVVLIDTENDLILEIFDDVGSEQSIFMGAYGPGTFCVLGMSYDPENPYFNDANTLSELLLGGGFFVLSECSEASTIYIGNTIPYASETTAPICNGDGTYSVGVTVSGSTGSAYVAEQILPEGQEVFITFTEPFYNLFATDVLTGCSDDVIIEFGPVDCPPACIDSSLIGSIDICPTIYEPVCACNGLTYDNECVATNAGATAYVSGICPTPQQLTICPGDSTQIGLIYQPNIIHTWLPTNGLSCTNCPDPFASPTVSTSYVLEMFYTTVGAVGSYQIFTVNVEDSPDCPPICIDTSAIMLDGSCFDLYDPVCGCNGFTFGNWCYAEISGITSFTNGECPSLSYQVCPGDSVQIGVEAMDDMVYTWGASDGLSCTNCPETWVSPTETTTYYLLSSLQYTGVLVDMGILNFEVEVLPEADCIIDSVNEPGSNNNCNEHIVLHNNHLLPGNSDLLWATANINTNETIELSIYSINGQQIYQRSVQAVNNGNYSENLDDLQQGIYIIVFETPTCTITHKIMKQ